MDSKTTSFSPGFGPDGASNQDEVFMGQTMLFSDTLKELKSLRKQLYSSAEYFEATYSNQDQNQIAMESLKDYAIKALISTVDHLGTVADKVNTILDENVSDVSVTQLRCSCLELRLQSCLEYINQGGFRQQSLMIQTPKYHKHYMLQDEEAMEAVDTTKSKHHWRSSSTDQHHLHQFKHAVQASTRGTPPSICREGQFSTSQPPIFLPKEGTFTFTRTLIIQNPDRKATTPQHFPFLRTKSVVKRSTSPENPNSRKRYPSAPRRSYSLSANNYNGIGERREKEVEDYSISTKSRRLLKTMLSMRRPRKNASFYKYLDDI